MLVQSAPLAGFQYYAGKILWDEMREGDRLALIREPDNPHDPRRARRVARHQARLPAPRDNRAVAAEMDKGTPMRAHRPPGRDPNPGSACGRRAGGFVSGSRPGGHSGRNARIAGTFRSS
jgi:hypothetical protein